MRFSLPNFGELDKRIVIRLWSDVSNGAYGLDQAFDPGLSRWAKADPIQGLAIRNGAQTGEEPTHFFWLRYGPGTTPQEITAAHVIEWNGRRYRVIDSINIAGAQRFTRITAKDLGAIS